MSTPATMRAAVYHPGNLNLVVETDFPVPQPKHEQVLLKVAACGSCHSEVFTLSNALVDNRTYVFGHETVGTAVLLGDGVSGIDLGTLYAIHAILPCVTGLPPILNSDGIGMNGGYAEYVAVDQRQLVPVPDGLAPEIAALATDSLLTAYNAIHNVAGLRPGTTKRVLIYGIGGLGHQALQIAKSYGATVFAVDYKPEARELALQLGADRVLTLGEVATETTTGTLNVDIAVDFVVNEQSFTFDKAVTKNDALNFTAPPSKIVLVGVSADSLPLNSAEVLVANTQVLPALYGSLDDLRACLDLLSQGVVKPVVQTVPLEAVDQTLNDLRASAVLGRRVVVPTLPPSETKAN
ncbi:GroES-like protein [Trametes polyzona]|nr:GroES-like protein [Trametes polyzona]